MNAHGRPAAGLRLALFCALLGPGTAYGQQLAGEALDVRDGLSNNEISSLFQDRDGYLWIATWEGVNRFDGRRCERMGVEHGLPPRVINAVTQDPAGTIWVATNGSGIARLHHGPSPRFEVIGVALGEAHDFINDFAFDEANRLWCATDGGLVRGEPDGRGGVRFAEVRRHRQAPRYTPVLRDRSGRIWVGMGPDLVAVHGSEVSAASPVPGDESIVELVDASPGTVIVVTTRSVFEFDPDAAAAWRRREATAPPGTAFHSATAAHGSLWFGAEGQVLEMRGDRVERWRIGRGLRPPVSAMLPDRDGNLWLGTTQGLFRVPPWRIVEFTTADGMPASTVARLLATGDGEVYASTFDAGLVALTGAGAFPVEGTTRPPFNQMSDRVVVTADGRWFVGASDAIHGFRLDEHGRRAHFDPRPVASIRGPERLQLDSSGLIWARTGDRSIGFRVDGDRLTAIDAAPTPPFLTVGRTNRAVWFGGMTTLTRFDGARLMALDTSSGLPETRPRAMLLDSRRTFWVGLRYEGLALTNEPDAPTPRFTTLSVHDGLSSNVVSCLAEGADGFVYIGTGRGLDRIDPVSRRIESIGPASVLSGAWVRSCVADRAGRVWASTVYGVARVDGVVQDAGGAAVPLYVSRVEVSGTPVVPPEGDWRAGTVELPPGSSSLRLRFSSPVLRPERRVIYQYRLAGLDDGWQTDDDSRTVEYGRLPPGRYRVRCRRLPARCARR